MWVRNFLFAGLCGAAALAIASSLFRLDADASPDLESAPLEPDQAAVVAQIDAAYRRAWREQGIAPAPPADDLQVARRLSLALAGTIPSLEEIRRFEAAGPGRLDGWTARLLADRRSADYLAERFARGLVGVEQGPFLLYRRRRLISWLSDQFYENASYAQIVRSLIADTGLWTDSPQTNFITVSLMQDKQNRPDENKLAARVSRALLGVRLDCAQCHDHPFDDDWKQSHFQGLAAFFGQAEVSLVGLRDTRGPYKVEDPESAEAAARREDALVLFGPDALDLPDVDRENPTPAAKRRQAGRAIRPLDANRNGRLDRDEIADELAVRFGRLDTNRDNALDRDELIDVMDGMRPVQADVPFRGDLLASGGSDRRRLADWVTHCENEYFARATVNRVWALMMGRALVEPVDDIPIEGPYPPALAILARDFAEHGHDLRRLIRIVAATEVFRLDSTAPGDPAESIEMETAGALFPLTRLRPEQVVGSLLQAASLTTIDYESHILVRIARQRGRDDFVRRYGDAGDAELESGGGTIPQRLLMLNGALVQNRLNDNLVRNAATRIAVLAPDDATAIETTYLAVLTRRPTPAEAAHFAAAFADKARGGQRTKVADLYWTLLNSTEFSWKH
jgi:hypothetical protein